MNQNPAISDDPLPEGERVAHAQADAPDHHAPQTFIHTDPHSLAAVSSQELHDPQLHRAPGSELDSPDMHTVEQPALVDAVMALTNVSEDVSEIVVVIPSKNQALNAQMAQVGLTSSDQWEEHFQPRIQKLNEDIALVHVELDKLERKKSTP
jgi:hypothetical protein